jgi:hypothetical protein
VTRPALPAFTVEPYEFMATARRLVFDYVSVRLAKANSDAEFHEDDISVYWFSKDGEDWRVLLTTTLPDNIYYRVNHSGINREIALDVYHKYDTITIPDKDNI